MQVLNIRETILLGLFMALMRQSRAELGILPTQQTVLHVTCLSSETIKKEKRRWGREEESC